MSGVGVSAFTTFKRRRVLVTGGTGFLGAWLVEELLEAGAHVVVLVRDRPRRCRFFADQLDARVDQVFGDILDLELLIRTLNEFEVETVFHLAAQAIVPVANVHPLSTFRTNVEGTWNLLEACRVAGKRVRRVVIASSDKAYGQADQLPTREDSPLAGRFPYDVSKSCADLISTSYHASFGLPVAVTRCGNFFGGGDFNTSRLVPGAILSLLRGEPPVIRSDGTLVRDWIFVRDGAHAYLTLAEAMERGTGMGQAYNFSYGVQHSALELVRLLARLTGREGLEPKILGEAHHEIPHQYLDAGRARRELAWEARWGLEEGLRMTIDWYRRQAEAGGLDELAATV